jgi:two-component system, NtrC family, nitrogen regulation response regulator GlnG
LGANVGIATFMCETVGAGGRSGIVRARMSREDPTKGLRRRGDRAPLGAVVRVVGNNAKPREKKLYAGSLVLGAGKGADVIVDDKAVSRAHVELSLVPEGIRVKDLGSMNGTFYLGQRVESIVLTLGSHIVLGTTEIALEPDIEALEGAPDTGKEGYRGLVGSSPAMRRLFAVLARLEGSLVSVFLEGESGVGKELIARAIHEGSSLAQGPMVTVNCAAFGRELVMSELFGHKKGAFTGAVEARRGAFEAANGGTLFLDEVGELPLEVQPMLLRALESGEVKPLGGDESRHVKVRVIAATNRDVLNEMKAGNFREDLYYRLAVVRLAIPPLRERPEDVGALARRFAAAAGMGTLPDEVVSRLVEHAWPGNARELRNAVQAYAALGTMPEANAAEVDLLETALRRHIDPTKSYQEQKDYFASRFTRAYLELLLARTGGNQSEAARVSGVDRSYLGKLIVKHGVQKSS